MDESTVIDQQTTGAAALHQVGLRSDGSSRCERQSQPLFTQQQDTVKLDALLKELQNQVGGWQVLQESVVYNK